MPSAIYFNNLTCNIFIFNKHFYCANNFFWSPHSLKWYFFF